MVEELSKLVFENLSISEKDVKLIKENPETREHFEKCMKELEKMKNTQFYGYHSYYSVLKGSIRVKFN